MCKWLNVLMVVMLLSQGVFCSYLYIETCIEVNSKDCAPVCRMQVKDFSLSKSLKSTPLPIMIFTAGNFPWGLLKIKNEKHDHMLKIKVLI